MKLVSRSGFWICIVFGTMCLSAGSVIGSDDPVESLIDTENNNVQNWFKEPHDIPTVYIWGDSRGVEIDNPQMIGNPTPLCSDIQYDEWLSLTESDGTVGSAKLNVLLPRTRETLSENCLIRPTDRVLAIGKGWQREVGLDSFVLRHSVSHCLTQFPYSLWGEFETELPATPLFYTTNVDLGEQDNQFSGIKWAKLTAQNRDAAGLRSAIQMLDDYSISISSLNANNADNLYFLERRTVSPEDDDLPHQILVWCKDGRCETLWLERVSHKNGSGHINVVGTLDFNHDGLRDLILTGDKGGCDYQKIFIGNQTGFSILETPEPACSC